jgi:hypothetical protein
MGTGARTAAFKALYQCLLTAQGPTGDDCQFDSIDMERVRYGSCGFFAPPLEQFEPTAKCENTAISAFYTGVSAAPCISISGMDNWKCAKLEPPTSLSVGATQAVVTLIILSVFMGYFYHMYHYVSSSSSIRVAAQECATAASASSRLRLPRFL